MAKAGAGKASALSSDGVMMPMALMTIARCFASKVSAHGGGLNAKRGHQERKRRGYHCHRGGGASSHSDAVPTNFLVPSRIAPLRVLRDLGVFANCVAARAAGAAPVRRGEPDMGRIWIVMGTEWGVSRGGGDVMWE